MISFADGRGKHLLLHQGTYIQGQTKFEVFTICQCGIMIYMGDDHVLTEYIYIHIMTAQNTH